MEFSVVLVTRHLDTRNLKHMMLLIELEPCIIEDDAVTLVLGLHEPLEVE